MNQSTTINSSRVRFGKRTYFFDVNQTANDKKYLKITESQFVADDQPRKYNSFVLFPDQVADFQKSLAEVAEHLK
jgi:hypothetical protein